MVITKLDLLKTYPEYYTATLHPKLVELEPYNYLTVAGKSSPNSSAFELAIDQLYGLAYKIKFICKEMEMDFIVPKLEAFWWAENDLPFARIPKENWCWKLLFRMPDFVGMGELNEALSAMIKHGRIPAQHDFALESMYEGKSVQVLHIGSYKNEAETMDKLFKFMRSHDLKPKGEHHEIYISDPRKVPEDKLKTIVRYAVQ